VSKLCFPVEVLNQHLVILGKTGAGKSSALRHVVEHLLAQKKRVCIVDPKGDWWGLKSSADGKDAGFPIIAFGDFKEPKATDIPINPGSGKHVAELITGGNRPCIIGFRGWMPGQMTDFWIDFASTLFNSSQGELFVVIDECHNFAPKGKILDPKAGKVLHWSNRLLSEGRGLGLVFLLASQRPQKVHNDTLTCCETLVAMRVNHAADRQAIKDWIDGCGDKAHGQMVLANVAQMQRGEAFIWSPEIGFGPERQKFPMFQTFDSFAPPQLQKKVSQSGWSEVDLTAVKDKLAAVIKEAEANDPKKLKAEIARLRAEVSKPGAAKHDPQAIERAVKQATATLEAAHRKNVATLQAGIDKLTERLKFIAAKAAEAAGAPLPKIEAQAFSVPLASVKVIESKVITPFVPARAQSNGHLPPGEKAVLTAAASYEDGLERDSLSVFTGYKRSSRDAYIQRLREKGYVSAQGDRIVATPNGVAALGEGFEPLPTGEALQAYWLRKLPEGERRVLEVLIAAYPNTVPRDAIDEHTGYKRSSRDAYLQRLSARRLVTANRGEVSAVSDLFN
jgi:hypothetical protein